MYSKAVTTFFSLDILGKTRFDDLLQVKFRTLSFINSERKRKDQHLEK